MADERGTSKSGDPILRHAQHERPFSVATGDPRTVERIGHHVERFAGPFDVLHEVISDLVHLDIFHAAPNADRNYHTLVTCGMSDRRMAVPWRLRALRYAELMLCLPADWPLSWEDLEDERYYWPIRLLKSLGRMPHEYETWLGPGHTVGNGEPPVPYADGIALCGIVLTNPRLFPGDFWDVRVKWRKTVNVYAVLPLRADELDFKLDHGFEALEKLLEGAGVNELLRPDRPSVVA